MRVVKLFWFTQGRSEEAEGNLALYLNEGWTIEASGGHYSGGGNGGYLVLVRET